MQLFDLPAAGVTAGECAATWLGMRRQVEIFIKPEPTPDPGCQMQLLVRTMRVCARVPIYPVQ
jgi:hypothetical protein